MLHTPSKRGPGRFGHLLHGGKLISEVGTPADTSGRLMSTKASHHLEFIPTLVGRSEFRVHTPLVGHSHRISVTESIEKGRKPLILSLL